MTAKPDDQIEDLVFECLEAIDAEAVLRRIAGEDGVLAARVRKVFEGLQQGDWLEPPPSNSQPMPTRFGPYAVTRELGRGGMGIVYLAQEAGLARRVALKVVRPEFLAQPSSRERFRREAEAASSLQHPGIVQVFAVGEEAGWPWFAMEFVEGRTLAAVLGSLRGSDPAELRGSHLLAEARAGQNPPTGSGSSSPQRAFGGHWNQACLHIARCLAEALQHAHSRGVLHRDIKPSNILLTPDGRALLTDFGLAKLEGAQDLTRSTTQLGSLPYLPPESLAARQPMPSPTLDVYQLGVVLYEMLALRHPYRGKHQEATRRRILEGRPAALRNQNRALERDLETVCLVAMDPTPGQRYPSMATLQIDLEHCVERRPIAARRPGFAYRTWRWLQRNPALTIALAITLVIATVAAVVVAGIERDAREISEDLTRQTRYELYRANLTAASAMLDQAANPGGAHELLRDCPPEYRGFEWRHLAARTADGDLLQTGEHNVPQATWSADRSLLVLAERGGRSLRFLAPRTGAVERQVELAAALRDMSALAMAADGRILLGHADGRVTLHDGQTGELSATLFDEALSGKEASELVAVPGTAHVVVVHADADVLVWNATNGELRTKLGIQQLRFARPPAVSGDGRRLAIADELGDRVVVFDTRSWQIVDELAKGWQMTTGLALDTTGQTLFASDTKGVFTAASGGAGWVQLGVPDAQGIAIAENGDRLFVVEAERRIAIYDYDAQQTSASLLRRLTGHTGRISRLLLADDGATLVSTGEDLTVRRYVVEHEGAQTVMQHGVPGAVALAFAEAGSQLVVGASTGHMVVLDVASGEVNTLASPHGQWVRSLQFAGSRLLSASYDGSLALWQWPIVGTGQPRVLRDEHVQVTCAALHPTLPVIVTGSPTGIVSVWNSESGLVDATFTAHADFVTSLSFSPDGDQLLSAAEDGTVRCFRWPSRELHREYEGFAGWVAAAIFTAHGEEIVAAGQDPRVLTWQRDNGRLLRAGTGHASPIFAVAATKHGERVFTCDVAREVHVWDRLGEKSLHAFEASAAAVSLAVDAAGCLLVVGHVDFAIDVLRSRPQLPDMVWRNGPQQAGGGLRPSRGYEIMRRSRSGK